MKQNSRLPVLQRRLNELLGDQSVTGFAESLQLTRQTLGFYLNGNRIPDSKTLLHICEACNVSADYLIGLSDAKSPDITIQAICDYTGLSEEAVSILHRMKNDDAFESSFAKVYIESILIDECIYRASEYILDAAYAMKSSSLETSADKVKLTVENRAIKSDDGRYYISASEAKDMFLTSAAAELAKSEINILDDMCKELSDSLEQVEPNEFRWLSISEDELQGIIMSSNSEVTENG